MAQQLFDAGIFCIMLIIGFASLVMYKKIGALILIVSALTFLIAGLIIVTGFDVGFYKASYPMNATGITTPANETDYLIGNGSTPIQFSGQLWMGYSLIVLALVVGIIFLDQTIKGNLIKGD